MIFDKNVEKTTIVKKYAAEILLPSLWSNPRCYSAFYVSVTFPSMWPGYQRHYSFMSLSYLKVKRNLRQLGQKADRRPTKILFSHSELIFLAVNVREETERWIRDWCSGSSGGSWYLEDPAGRSTELGAWFQSYPQLTPIPAPYAGGDARSGPYRRHSDQSDGEIR